MAKPEIFVDNVLRIFYFVDSSEDTVLYPYTESLLQLCLQLESLLMISVIQKLLRSDQLVKWPNFNKEDLLRGGETQIVVGQISIPEYKLLKITKFKRYIDPFIGKINIPQKGLNEFLLKLWAVPKGLDDKNMKEWQISLEKSSATLKLDKNLWTIGLSLKEAELRSLVSKCKEKIGLYISFDSADLQADIYLKIENIDIKLIVLIILASSARKYELTSFRRFATWHNIIDYFWFGLNKTVIEGPKIILNPNSPLEITNSATLPLLFYSKINFIS